MPPRLPLVVTCVVTLSAACGDDPAPPVATVVQGHLELRVWDAPARLALVRDGEVVWETAPGRTGGTGFVATRQTAPTLPGYPGGVQMSFGSFRFGPDADTPWQGVTALRGLEVGPDAVSFALAGDDGTALGRGTATLSAADDGGELVLSLDLASAAGNRAALAFGCTADEHFLGLGGQSWAIDHRGQAVPLWVQEDGIGKLDVADDDYEGVWALTGRRHSTHTPMPMMLSSRGWALAIDTSARAVFDLCAAAPATARLETWDQALALHLFVGPTPRQAIDRLTAWVGRPEVPPAFAFAPWLDAIYGEASVRRVADALRAADVPVSALWTEDWRGGNDESAGGGGYVLEENWRVARDIYPDFEGLAADLHQRGFKFLTYANTFIDSQADVYAEALALGHEIKRADGSPYLFTGVKFRDSTMLDLTNPAAVAWAKGVYGEAIALGSDGWMADFAEWLPTDAQLASGQDALTYHNRYPVDWAKLNWELVRDAEAADGVERLTFARAAHLGAQRYVQVLWAGDQQTDWSDGDGLPSVIPMGIGLGLTGFPYFGHDIAGYMSQTTVPVTQELWFRWVTFGALSPVMRTHHGRSARDNWNWERDAASTAHLARWARLHMQLVPYQLTMAAAAAATGAPLFRPFVLDYPAWAPGWSITDEYLLGDRIAVAPVQVEGATTRDVRLPAGTWYGLLDGAAVVSDGAAPHTATATATEIPAFVPDCAVLALYPPEVDTVVDAAPGIVTAASIGDDREVWIYPCAATPGPASTLTEPGGLAYTRGPGAVAASGAAWNGAPITFTTDGRWLVVDVVGPGALTVGGTEVVRVSGGAATRRLRLRLVAP
ncbi:MAG: glycoside hydrolase family 31 protein [Kofleriaceae bacterium]